MLLAGSIFVGVDPTAARKAFTYAALDRDLNLLELTEGESEEVLDFLAAQKAAFVAVNSPSQLNTGFLRRSQGGEGSTSHHMRGVEMRVAEHELRERGIPVSGTPAREALCSPWVRVGLRLYRVLAERGFEPYPADDCRFQWLETHPHAAFCALLGRSPLSKAAVEGRLQRQLILHERGLRIHDPMNYFEEITRHRLLNGVLPTDIVYLPEQLDALVAAYTAWVAIEKQGEFTRLGNDEEGYISLPAAPLKDKY